MSWYPREDIHFVVADGRVDRYLNADSANAAAAVAKNARVWTEADYLAERRKLREDA